MRPRCARILRILRPWGRALLLTPYAHDGKGTDEDPRRAEPPISASGTNHIHIYDREDFLARMRRAGFETAVFAPFEICPEAAEALHLNLLEVLPVRTKP